MTIEIKNWIYQDMQIKAQKYNRTLIWEVAHRPEIDSGRWTNEYTFKVTGNKVAETEKAVQFDLYYWNLAKAGRYVTDAPVESGWKVWIPKSAIIKM